MRCVFIVENFPFMKLDKDLISGGILKPLQLTVISKNGFRNYMKSIGKLGGQNKVPRLANDRKIADKLNIS